MRKLILAAIALTTAAIVSCSDNTSTLGNTLTIEADQYDVLTDTFDVATRSIKLDSVLSNSVYSYLGRLKDPETGSYITSDYMTQFNILDNQASKLFPDVDEMIEKGAEFPGYADSCYVSIVINSYQGDSLAAMNPWKKGLSTTPTSILRRKAISVRTTMPLNKTTSTRWST